MAELSCVDAVKGQERRATGKAKSNIDLLRPERICQGHNKLYETEVIEEEESYAKIHCVGYSR